MSSFDMKDDDEPMCTAQFLLMRARFFNELLFTAACHFLHFPFKKKKKMKNPLIMRRWLSSSTRLFKKKNEAAADTGRKM